MGKMPLESGNLIQMQSGAIRGSRDEIPGGTLTSVKPLVSSHLGRVVVKLQEFEKRTRDRGTESPKSFPNLGFNFGTR